MCSTRKLSLHRCKSGSWQTGRAASHMSSCQTCDLLSVQQAEGEEEEALEVVGGAETATHRREA